MPARLQPPPQRCLTSLSVRTRLLTVYGEPRAGFFSLLIFHCCWDRHPKLRQVLSYSWGIHKPPLNGIPTVFKCSMFLGILQTALTQLAQKPLLTLRGQPCTLLWLWDPWWQRSAGQAPWRPPGARLLLLWAQFWSQHTVGGAWSKCVWAR